MKKLFSLFLTVLLCFTAIGSNTVFAASGVLQEDRTNQAEFHLLNGSAGWEGTYYWWGLATIGGQPAYCIDPTSHTNPGSTYTTGNFFNTLPAQQRQNMWRIAYFGYGFEGDVSLDRYLAAQELIWEQMNLYQLRGFGSKENFQIEYQKVRGNVSLAAINNYKNIINSLISTYDTKPSFNGESRDVKVGDIITLTDTNGVLDRFNVTVPKGMELVSKTGNTLKVRITSADVDGQSIRFSKKYQPSMDSTFVWEHGDDQKLMTFGSDYFDPLNSYIAFNIAAGDLEIAKKDNEGNFVPDTTFRVSYNSDMSDPIGDYTTGKDGTVTVEGLNIQTVYIQEIKVPEHLVLDSTIRSVEIIGGETVTYTATNNIIQGQIRVTKLDADTGKAVLKAGTQFDIYNALTDAKVATITTDNSGVATSNLLNYGIYYVKEATAPGDYLIQAEASDPILVYVLNRVYDVTISNERVTGTVNLTKEDSVYGDTAQGEATLEGAVYGLYAKEDILDPSGDGTVIHAKDSLVASLTTDAQGKASVSDLYLGRYYLKEITASEGYTLDTNVYDITLSYADQNTTVITASQTVKEKVKSQAFQIIKVTDGDDDQLELLEGAEFTYIPQTYVEEYGSFDAALKAIQAGETDILESEWGVMVTDANGYAKSKELPFGTYYVSETKVPDPDSLLKVDDFTVTVTEDSREPQQWKILNDELYESQLKIVKEDAETGNIVQLKGATFKIFDKTANDYVSFLVWNPLPTYMTEFTTDESGVVYLPETLKAGSYRLEEIKAPDGYLLDAEPIDFEIKTSNVTQVGDDGETPVFTLTMADTSAKGQIKVSKEGEVLVGIETDENGNLQFLYETQKLAGATINLYAAEDIYSADNSKTLIYAKDALVETITTTENGGESALLPLGNYYAKEITAPNGMVISDARIDIALDYEGQETEIVIRNADFTNERQKVELNVSKVDADTGEPIQGAEFTIYAKEDIALSDGTVLVKADEKIETAASDENGQVHFKADLPLSQFYVKETKAPTGYASTDEVFNIDASYQGQDVPVIQAEKTFANEIITVEISKKDATTGEELPGNELTVYEKDNEENVVDQWTSTDEPHIIKGLEVGKTYILHEITSSHGFALANDVEFTVLDTGEVQKVEMVNEMILGQLAWNKTGEIFTHTDTWQTEFGTVHTPVWEKSNLLGAEITIYAAEDITLGNNVTYYQQDEVIEVLESDWETVYSKELPVGNYYYVETLTPHGRIPDTEKHYFEIKDSTSSDLQVIESELENHRSNYEIDFTKQMEFGDTWVNENAYKDVVFGVYTLDDTYNYMGEVALPYDTLVGTSGIDENGHLIQKFDLPVGNYYLKELATNSAYKLDETIYPFSIEQSTEETVTISVNGGEPVVNKLNQYFVLINKVDENTGENIVSKEFAFTSYKDAECKEPIETKTADTENGTVLFTVNYGFTYIKETAAPEGYGISSEVVEVEVNDDGLFINGNKVESGADLEYSIVFPNSLLPIIRTGASADSTFSTVVLGISIVGIAAAITGVIILKKKKNK